VTETTIGSAHAISYDDARAKAAQLRRLVLQGQDPVKVRRAERAARTTWGEAAMEWLALHPSWSIARRRNAERALLNHGTALVAQAIAHMDVNMIEAAIKSIWADYQNQGRRTLGIWERMLDYARHKGYRTGDNPAAWKGNMEFRFPDKPSRTKHFASMPYTEVPDFIRRLRMRQARRATSAAALEFVILTASRSGEVLGMTWDEVDLPNRLWTIPAQRTKTRTEHRVPLSDRAMAILAHQREYNPAADHVFPGRNGVALQQATMRLLLVNMGVAVTVHGFRSSFRDWAGDCTDFYRENIEECLAHSVGNQVEQAYRRLRALEKRRVIMVAWAAYCDGQSPATSAHAPLLPSQRSDPPTDEASA
jgi:integrase